MFTITVENFQLLSKQLPRSFHYRRWRSRCGFVESDAAKFQTTLPRIISLYVVLFIFSLRYTIKRFAPSSLSLGTFSISAVFTLNNCYRVLFLNV